MRTLNDRQDEGLDCKCKRLDALYTMKQLARMGVRLSEWRAVFFDHKIEISTSNGCFVVKWGLEGKSIVVPTDDCGQLAAKEIQKSYDSKYKDSDPAIRSLIDLVDERDIVIIMLLDKHFCLDVGNVCYPVIDDRFNKDGVLNDKIIRNFLRSLDAGIRLEYCNYCSQCFDYLLEKKNNFLK